MKKIPFSAILLMGWAAAVVAQDATDPVVMKVAGKDVLRSEFEYALNKNSNGKLETNPKAIADYADMYVNYRLKVQAALDDTLDKKESFLEEYNKYRVVQLRPYLMDKNYMENEARKIYDQTKATVGDEDIILVSHIMFGIPRKSGDDVVAAKKALADSVYALLKNGADFADLAKRYSDDKMSAAKGGELPWLGPKSSLPEFEEAAYKLQPGQLSEPFLSTAGYHIVLMKERKQLEPYEQRRQEIIGMLKEKGYESKAMEQGIQNKIDESNGALSREQVLDNAEKEAVRTNSDLRNLLKEYHDGLLLYEETNGKIWKKAATDKAGLENYFKKNKKKYTWDEPRFKGSVVLTRTQEILDKLVPYVEKCNSKEDIENLKKQINPRDRSTYIIKFGVYKDGDESHVNAKIYGKAEPKANKSYPFYKVVGKKIKAPETFMDDRARVIADYQNEQEQEWVKSLRKKYPFTINKSVLATVNKH
ncbi:MAG: peptidylprolyl isomerase [Bacteroidaceae bacterium]|nr:peptidylprolyl isomerase [Bacteroidaceae bacterium]